MKIQVALDEAGKAKPVPPQKPAGKSSRQQHQQNNKRKADQPAQHYDNRLVAATGPAADPAAKPRQIGKMAWQPTMSFEEMLDAPQAPQCREAVHTHASAVRHHQAHHEGRRPASPGSGSGSGRVAAATASTAAPGRRHDARQRLPRPECGLCRLHQPR